MVNNKNNLPPCLEEAKVNQEINLQILTQFRQSIPSTFLSLEFAEGNYCGSTNPKWSNKPLCERYGFDYKGEWTQIDIPHELMEKLELEKGQDIIQPVYLDPQVLVKKSSYGGITLEREAEIILVDPEKIAVKEQGVQTELDKEKIAKWESQLKDIPGLSEQIKGKDNQINQLKQQVKKLEIERDNLNRLYEQLSMNNGKLQTHSDRQKGLIDSMSEHMGSAGLLNDEFQNQILELSKFKV